MIPLILFAEVQNLTADLVGVVLGQVLQVHVVLPIGLGTIVSHCVWSGFLYSGLQQLAAVAVRISAPAGVYSQLISQLIQNAAHCEGVCVCKADTAQLVPSAIRSLAVRASLFSCFTGIFSR